MAAHRIPELAQEVWPEVFALLNRPWETPTASSHAISALLQASELLQVTVIGAPGQQILCLVDQELMLLCGLHEQVTTHPFVRELREELAIHFRKQALGPHGMSLTAPLSARLKNRLRVPSVLLVSLFHPEMYPATRLTLGIAYLASYLRLHHLAYVELIDCQFGSGVQEILAQIRRLRPEILGISVNFGQFDLMQQLLDGIYAPTAAGEPPTVILGNILPAMCYKEILDAYPEVVICRKEGELALAALVRTGNDRTRWQQVPGIYYRSSTQRKLVSTTPAYLPLECLPPPALDTVAELFQRDGVITAEFSRGCQYNLCSFCPRTHKGSIWRTLPTSSMLEQWKIFAQTFQHFQRTPHVFLADEDFIGREEGEATLSRVTSFIEQTRAQGLHITFDASCRADQIFCEEHDAAWHIQRGKLFRQCRDGGLLRLFLGVESGASAQLLRYNKGSSVDEMASAIRYFSLLGVQLRFGFIFFDPLMSVQDLLENIAFLGRTDVILPPARAASVEEIFEIVSSNHRQAMPQIAAQPVYEDVSYMVSPLEVLAKSRYLFDLRHQAPQLVSERVDVSFARYRATYAVPEIGEICLACQYWVNYCFPIVYTLKGLQKVSQGDERKLLHQAITGHRYLGYALIRSLAQIFSLTDEATLEQWEHIHAPRKSETECCRTARELVQAGYVEEAILSVLTYYEEEIRRLTEMINTHIDMLSPSKQQVWQAAYHTWIASSLAETRALRVV